MLKKRLKLAKNVISKNSIISKIFLKEIFKFLPHYCILSLKAIFLLMLLLNYCFVEKQGSKRNLIWPIGHNNFKMILTLLAEAIAI